ncbi:lipocalin family protein [Kaistella faecalis]|uniref:lipocalin family protein n=1 Tax=Kaistella faecalis TaxID=2852098 RepID=UPI001C4807E1|nr:lipocalin family protein [Chryseobacterium faecale]UFK97221.1 lipocalin family protein [Chryseobacterium faecale]
MKKLTKIVVPVSLGILGLLIFSSCSVKIPEGATAVNNFEKEKYLGKWYEIARLDFKWEKNMEQVTAEYSLKDNGHIKVDNKGYNYVKKEWKQSIGEARFVEDEKTSRLKVSFFKPFWAGYNVIELAGDYQYALVVGDDLDNMWILSREKTIPEDIKQRFLSKAKSLGYKTEELVWTKQN